MDGIKDASELTLRWGDYPGLAGEPNIITRVLKGERGRHITPEAPSKHFRFRAECQPYSACAYWVFKHTGLSLTSL